MRIRNKLVKHGKWFEPRGISYLFAMIVRVRVVVKKDLLVTDVSLVTNNSLSKNYRHLDDHAKQIKGSITLFVFQLL